MDQIDATCRTPYKAYHHGGMRPVSDVHLIVMHDTEGGTAESIAHYFSTPSAGGSAHLVVDDNACYRCLPNTVVPWGAPGANTNGFHIEQCGYAKWTRDEWLKHDKMLERAAYKAAYHCKVFNIPAVFVDADGLRKGHKGITTHAEVSKAWPNDSGNHHDPGTGWPRDEFMRRVRDYLKYGGL